MPSRRWPFALPNVSALGFLQQKGSASAAQQGKICFPQFLTLGGAGLVPSEGAIPIASPGVTALFFSSLLHLQINASYGLL